MSNHFSIVGTESTPADTVVSLTNTAASAFNAALYSFMLASVDTNDPEDANIIYSLGRTTTLGTATEVTPVPKLFGGTASISTGYKEFTVEPAYTANESFLHSSFHQRNYIRWIAVPGGEIYVKAANNAGLGLLYVAISDGTPDLAGSIDFKE